MTEALERAAKAAYEWLCAEHDDDPRLNTDDPRHWEGWAAERIARAAILAFLDAVDVEELRRACARSPWGTEPEDALAYLRQQAGELGNG